MDWKEEEKGKKDNMRDVRKERKRGREGGREEERKIRREEEEERKRGREEERKRKSMDVLLNEELKEGRN